MYVLYDIDTGAKISDSSAPITKVRQGQAVKQTDKTGIWNPQTLDYDPKPAKKIKTPLEFMELFTDAELAVIYAAADVDASVNVFIKKLERAQEVDLGNPTTITGVNALEAGGLIAPNRSTEILDG